MFSPLRWICTSTLCFTIIVVFVMQGFTVTFDAAKLTADIRFHAENDYVIKIMAIEGTLSYQMSWPRDAGTVWLFRHEEPMSALSKAIILQDGVYFIASVGPSTVYKVQCWKIFFFKCLPEKCFSCHSRHITHQHI